jgi:hypothetical protein
MFLLWCKLYKGFSQGNKALVTQAIITTKTSRLCNESMPGPSCLGHLGHLGQWSTNEDDPICVSPILVEK